MTPQASSHNLFWAQFPSSSQAAGHTSDEHAPGDLLAPNRRKGRYLRLTEGQATILVGGMLLFTEGQATISSRRYVAFHGGASYDFFP